MIAAVRAAFHKPLAYSSNVKTALLFHSSPILQRKHKSNSETRNKKFSRSRAKQDLRRNVNAFAEHLFGIWSDGFDYSDKHTSWFEKQTIEFAKETGLVDTFINVWIKRKSRWRERHFYGSNTHDEDGEAHSWRYSNNDSGRFWGWRQRLDEEEEEEKKEEEEDEHSSTEVNDLDSSQQSHRQTLGLSSSGPLSLEDVKNAYRVCAFKWHPDRHQDSTKSAAEEKFKLCTVAYDSLCEKFAMK
ncbi:hypothetical protein Bca52824_077644 [Brassica carinata]|uniref:J domain-containing protein n=1 Tax=Brassica carinata TaxID=52824 RepID=A0A8X7PVC6_BRACI|nr:hypothetical protein Bca52824_077644 [Brassica carinata]